MHLSLDANVKQGHLNKLEEAVNNGNTVLLNHANWCFHCKAFAPEWSEFTAQMKKSNPKTNIMSVESSAIEKVDRGSPLFKKITKKEGNEHVLYFPMIIVFVKKGDSVVKKVYEGPRNAKDLKSFVEKEQEKAQKATPTPKFKEVKLTPHPAKRAAKPKKPQQKGGANGDIRAKLSSALNNIFGT